MASTDTEVFNPRERPLSSDQNDMQSLLGRFFVEQLMYQMYQSNLASNDSSRNVVLGGLDVYPSGNNVTVAAGMLAQYSTTLSPIPGALDSNYRVGRMATPFAQTMPSPSSDTYYILEAQVSVVTTVTSSRDILNAGTGVMAPANVPKQQENHIAFQLTAGAAGGNAPSPSGGDWIPIALIKRPAGGGAVLASHIIDLRLRWNANPNANSLGLDRRGTFDLVARSSAAVPTAYVGLRTKLPAVIGNPSQAAYFNIATNFDISATRFKEAGSAAYATGALWHAYLCTWNGVLPANAYGDLGATSRGILILSPTVPTRGTGGAIIASNTLIAPAPWGVSVPGAQCTYVGTLKRNATNDGWVSQGPASGYSAFYGAEVAQAGGVVVTTGSGTLALSLAGYVPAGAKAVKVRLYVTNAAAGTSVQVTEQNTNVVGAVYRQADINNNGHSASTEVDIALSAADYPATLYFYAAGATNFTLGIFILGYEM